MHKNVSPEEKLLSIIKGNNKSQPAIPAEAPQAQASQARNKIDDYISALSKNAILKKSVFDPAALRAYNRYMIIAGGLIALYLIMDILLVSPYRKAAHTISSLASSATSIRTAEKKVPIETKNYSYYSSKLSGRSLFTGGPYSSSAPEELSDDEASDNIGLVGIMPGNNPQAIIEDKKAQKTYYLIKGQSINGITVDDVKEGNVILDYKGRKLTLFL